MYVDGQTSSDLANEAGDVMFAFEENELARDEYNRAHQIGYWDKQTTKYSYKVEEAYENRKKGDLSKDRNVYPLIYVTGEIRPYGQGDFKDN